MQSKFQKKGISDTTRRLLYSTIIVRFLVNFPYLDYPIPTGYLPDLKHDSIGVRVVGPSLTVPVAHIESLKTEPQSPTLVLYIKLINAFFRVLGSLLLPLHNDALLHVNPTDNGEHQTIHHAIPRLWNKFFIL